MKAIIDCNSFYASCEKVFRPDLNGRPIVVLSNNDGCIIARNDEAKAAGMPMGAPFFKIREQITAANVAVFSSNYALYGDLSRRVMEVIYSINKQIEVYSVDEVFIDVDHIAIAELTDYCRYIIDTVYRWTGIPVSIGVGRTKVLAKVANRLSKKNKALYKGLYVLDNEQKEVEALKATAVEDIWGVGRQYTKKLRLWGIGTAFELSKRDENWGQKYLGGVVGVRLLKELKGICCLELQEGLETKKMITSTRSFGRAVCTLSEMKEAIATYTCRAAEKLRLQESVAGYIYVFMITNRFSDNDEYTKRSDSMTLPIATSCSNLLIQYAQKLVENCYREGLRYKKGGVVLSMIIPQGSVQGNLFDTATVDPRHVSLQKTLDYINRKNGIDTIKYAATGIDRNWKMRSEERSPLYTTSWNDIPKIGR